MEAHTTKQLLEIIVEAADVHDRTLSMETTFEELGMDSLDFMEMMSDIAARIKPIPKSRFFAIDTIGDLFAEMEKA
jgi:acyl carrier protein